MDSDFDSDLLLMRSLLLVFAPSSCVRTLVGSFSFKCRCIRHRWLVTSRHLYFNERLVLVGMVPTSRLD